MRPPRLAVLTGDGPGAVGVVRIWGEGALAVADSAFRPHRGEGLAATPAGRLRPRLGRVGSGVGDEVVAIVVPGEPPEVEVQGHGGPEAIAMVVEALVQAGAERARASAWVRHASGSRLRAEATVDLPRSTTLRATAHLLDQANGALDEELALICGEVASRPRTAIERLDVVISRSSAGIRLVPGWRVALAGRPNVGKSRLLNALLGYGRAIVDPTPGTTRDVVSTATAFGGWPVELSDTAGLRASDDPIEAEGVARARAQHRAADLVLLVLDRSEPLTDEDYRLMMEHPQALVVANKADLPAVWDSEALVVSAARGDGIERLATEVGHRLVPEPPPAGSAIPFRGRHVRRLRLIRDGIERGEGDRAILSLNHWLRK
jgi:tRNA modification GTPase